MKNTNPLTMEQLEALVLSYMLISGGENGESTEDELIEFMKRCDQAAQVGDKTADLVRGAADRKYHIGWDKAKQAFIFNEKPPTPKEFVV